MFDDIKELSKPVGVEALTLDEWFYENTKEEDRKSLFLNMDRALKYIHENGYCIYEFYPKSILVLAGSDKYIQFCKLIKLSSDFTIRDREIKEDIFNSCLIQIGMYSNALNYLKPQFLMENFSSFLEFIPSDLAPYYRGVVERGATVYLCEYLEEKTKRDLTELQKDLGVESNNVIYHDNNKANKLIYKGLKNGQAAFVSVTAILLIVLVILVFLIILDILF